MRMGRPVAARDFKLVLDTWRMHADPDREERTAQERFDSRSVHLSTLLDGMGRLDGTLDPEGLALVREAIRALSQPADDEPRTAAQRRADALVGMARIVIAHLEPAAGQKRRKPKVFATIAYDDLVTGSGGGVIDTDTDTTVVPVETIRRMACDCDVHRYITNPQGTVVDYGRRQRVVPEPLFDTLLIRDHGCRWPGCAIPAGSCDAHHATHYTAIRSCWTTPGRPRPAEPALAEPRTLTSGVDGREADGEHAGPASDVEPRAGGELACDCDVEIEVAAIAVEVVVDLGETAALRRDRRAPPTTVRSRTDRTLPKPFGRCGHASRSRGRGGRRRIASSASKSSVWSPESAPSSMASVSSIQATTVSASRSP